MITDNSGFEEGDDFGPVGEVTPAEPPVAPAEPEEPEVLVAEDLQHFVIHFFNSLEPASFEQYYTANGKIFAGQELLAAVGGKALVLHTTNSHADLYDHLIWAAGHGSYLFARLYYPTNGDCRISDFTSANEKARVATEAFGITVDIDKQLALYEERENLNKRIEEIEQSVRDQYRAVDEEVKRHFEQAAKAKLKEQYVAFDRGDTVTGVMSDIKGEGGQGQRLRIERNGGGDIVFIRANSGYDLTIARFKRGFNMVAPYIYGDKVSPNISYTVGELQDSRLKIFAQSKLVQLGCQTISYAELTRIATMLGWPLDGTTVS